MDHGPRFAVTRRSVSEAEEAWVGQVLTCAGMQARAHRSTTRHERRVGVSPHAAPRAFNWQFVHAMRGAGFISSVRRAMNELHPKLMNEPSAC